MHEQPRKLIASLLLIAVPLAAWSLPWSKDMRDQPSVKANEGEVAMASTSVPVQGKEEFPVPQNIAELVQARLLAGAQLTNPVPATPESLNRGAALYSTHCAICHGDSGLGDGTVGKKFVPPPMNLTISYVQIQPDGQLYFTITHGSIAMPPYRDALARAERWDVVNYVKNVLREAQE